MRGRLIVVGVLLVAALLGVVGAHLRSGRGPTLPLQPGTVVLVTVASGAVDLGPLAAEATTFSRVAPTSRDPVRQLGALLTGRMARQNGLVDSASALRPDVQTLTEMLLQQGFVTAAFVSGPRPLAASGLLRGAQPTPSPTAARSQDPGEIAAEASKWIVEQGARPTFCWVHLEATKPEESSSASYACGKLCAEFVRAGLGPRLVLVAVSLTDEPTLALRLPGPLLPAGPSSRRVSLLDLTPSLLELMGIPAPNGPGELGELGELGEPFLLDPRLKGPRFFLEAEPLPAPFADVDVVTLSSGDVAWSLDPTSHDPAKNESAWRTPAGTAESHELPVTPELSAEFARVLTEGFGYEIVELQLPEGRRVKAARWPGAPRLR